MGLFSAIFGGSSQESGNRNLGMLNSSLGPALQYATQGGKGLSDFLKGDASGFNNYKRAAGFDWLTKEGSKGILGNMAARGLLRSGAAGKALVNYGNEMSNTYANDYMKSLLGLGGLGMQAGSTLASAGQYGKGSSDTGAFGSFLGAILSDENVKTDITRIGTLPNGLPVYEYVYTFAPDTRHVGVMAQDVERILPEALGPDFYGFKTVNYAAIFGDR